MTNKTLFLSYMAVAMAGILYGGVVFGVKVLANMGMSISELLILPNVIIVILLAPFIYKKTNNFFILSPILILIFATTLFMTQVGEYLPLFMGLSVSLVELFVYTQPLWTILFSVFFLHHAFKTRDAIVCTFVLLGLITLINPFDSFHFSITGSILALLAGVGLSAFVLVNTYASNKKMSSKVFVFFSNIFLSVPFIIIYPFIYNVFPHSKFMRFSLDLGWQTWTALLIYSIGCYIIAPTLLFYGSRTIPPIHSGLLLLLEPVVAICLDIIFLHFNITWNIIIGGMLIITANIYLIISESMAKKKERLYKKDNYYGRSVK